MSGFSFSCSTFFQATYFNSEPICSPQMLPQIFREKTLPDCAGLFTNHGIAFFAAEGFGKLGHVGERTVAAEARERMRIGLRLQAGIFGAFAAPPKLGPPEEER